ncbi:MAG: flagellar biosynthesis protein FlhB [Candidatus Riflebacteria bacterium HGW-Riflebacteria-1]|jgi:flagellar biosynthetic protein FlhB|nr:MAG: flagellar biosynthesis protein FlhB [Candidatus Riflebacteria bacterium HGW-Riflebacteria-1]
MNTGLQAYSDSDLTKTAVLTTLSLIDRDFDLQLFAGEKTEPATEKRRQEAVDRGNIAKSQDLSSVIVLLTGFLMLRFYGPQLFGMCGEYMRYIFSQAIFTNLTLPDTLILLNQFIIIILRIMTPFMFAIMLGSIASNLIQTGFLFRFDPLMPDIERLNPISGIQNIFSWKMVAELVKSILKILIVSYIPYSTIRENIPMLVRFIQLDPVPAIIILLKTAFAMSIKIILILLFLALADWAFQIWRHEENIKMSKDEIKEEYKQREGDPRVKQKIREKQRQASTRRMMEEVPKATVVVTNPTHIACALRYNPDNDNAPVLVAMGTGLIARKIKEIAAENNVPIIENKPLARQLHKMLEVGDEIPSDLYNAVVEILAQVYRMKNRTASA